MNLWRPAPTRRQQPRRMQLQDLQQRRIAPYETPFCEAVTIGPCENMSEGPSRVFFLDPGDRHHGLRRTIEMEYRRTGRVTYGFVYSAQRCGAA